MVLRPVIERNFEPQAEAEACYFPAWDVVSQLQRQAAPEYCLIAQADHARLSGALARAFRSPLFPAVSQEVAQAIAVHDQGWAIKEQQAGKPVVTFAGNGRPASFLDATPEEFIRAWKGSIQHAAQLSALGGLLVSHHFSRLGRHRLNLQSDSPHDAALLENFLFTETRRRERLRAEVQVSGNLGMQDAAREATIERLVDLLQLCDLLSLYLCSGAMQPAEFPQKFDDKTIRIAPDEDRYRLQPSLFGSESVCFSVPAVRFPFAADELKTEILAFRVR